MSHFVSNGKPDEDRRAERNELMDRQEQRIDELEAANAALLARAEAAEADAESLRSLIRTLRDDFAGLPHSLGYEFTHLPKIDAALAARTIEADAATHKAV